MKATVCVADGESSRRKPIKDEVGTELVNESKSLLNLIEGAQQQYSNSQCGAEMSTKDESSLKDENTNDKKQQPRSNVIFMVIVEGCEFVIKGTEWSVRQL